MDTLEIVLSKLEKVEEHGSYWMACCPAHDDHNPSLMVSEGDNEGLVLLHCFAGCAFTEIAQALGMSKAELCGHDPGLTEAELQARKTEARLRRLEREHHEQAKRLSALERISKCKDYIYYNKNLDNEELRSGWFREGVYDAAIERFTLGFCSHCPTDWQREGGEYHFIGRPSLTIPAFYNLQLRNIRHRLIGASDGNKYRPHMRGLGNVLFNADDLNNFQRAILWEGEKKSMVMWQHLEDTAHVAIMGKSGFDDSWIPLFDRHDLVIALDPDALGQAYKIGRRIQKAGGCRNVAIASFPTKPDDMINLYQASLLDVESILRQVRPV